MRNIRVSKYVRDLIDRMHARWINEVMEGDHPAYDLERGDTLNLSDFLNHVLACYENRRAELRAEAWRAVNAALQPRRN